MTIAEPVGIGSEYAGENGVKRPCPQALSCLCSYQCGDAFFHLVGRFVGEGECQQPVGRISHLQQVCYLVGKYSCFTRSGSGDNQFRSIGIEYGFALLVVQTVQKILFHFSFPLLRAKIV